MRKILVAMVMAVPLLSSCGTQTYEQVQAQESASKQDYASSHNMKVVSGDNRQYFFCDHKNLVTAPALAVSRQSSECSDSLPNPKAMQATNVTTECIGSTRLYKTFDNFTGEVTAVKGQFAENDPTCKNSSNNHSTK